MLLGVSWGVSQVHQRGLLSCECAPFLAVHKPCMAARCMASQSEGAKHRFLFLLLLFLFPNSCVLHEQAACEEVKRRKEAALAAKAKSETDYANARTQQASAPCSS